MGGKMSRNKGSRGELEFCHLIKDHLGIDVSRNLDQTREGGGDIGLLDMLIEVKRQKVPSIGSWWSQAVASARPKDLEPVLAYRLDHKPWRVRTRLVNDTMEDWTYDVSYTIDMDIAGFFYICRERM